MSVTEAENGKEALALLERGRFDVMLTDLLAARHGGRRARRHRAIAPVTGLGIIFASGYDRVPNRDAAPSRTPCCCRSPMTKRRWPMR